MSMLQSLHSYHTALQTAFHLAQTLAIEPLLDNLVYVLGLLCKCPVRSGDLTPREIWNKSIHALRHLGFENGIVCRLDEEYRLFDDLFV